MVLGDLTRYKNIKEFSKNIKKTYLESIIYNSSSIISDGKIIGGNETDKSLIEFIKNDYYKKDKSNVLWWKP